MFRSLLETLFAPAQDTFTAQDADLALAALLVRIARADERYDTAEQVHIEQIMAHRCGLNADEATALRHAAETAEAEAPDTVRFTRVLKDRIPYDDRINVIETMWQVAVSDNHRHAEEDAVIRLVANLLGINDRDSAFARQRVQQKTE